MHPIDTCERSFALTTLQIEVVVDAAQAPEVPAPKPLTERVA